jgi:hypothetical protein
MVLPFEPKVEWNLISGPHGAWIGQERDDAGLFVPVDINSPHWIFDHPLLTDVK